MKTYREIFDNGFYPDIKVMNFDEIMSKNADFNTKFAEKMQISSENSSKNDFFIKNETGIIPTSYRNVTPKRSFLQKIRGD